MIIVTSKYILENRSSFKIFVNNPININFNNLVKIII